MKLASLIPAQQLCAAVSRADFYRWQRAPPAVDADLDLRDEIQRIALEWSCYGWRRVTAELHHRGWLVNHKRVRRLMREDKLLCLRRRKFVVTTDSDHELPVYPNRAGDLVLTGLDQLWVADITYIRLETELPLRSRHSVRLNGLHGSRLPGGDSGRSRRVIGLGAGSHAGG